jgi:hypothetical protein
MGERRCESYVDVLRGSDEMDCGNKERVWLSRIGLG